MTAEDRSPRAPPVAAGDAASSWESSGERRAGGGGTPCSWAPGGLQPSVEARQAGVQTERRGLRTTFWAILSLSSC